MAVQREVGAAVGIRRQGNSYMSRRLHLLSGLFLVVGVSAALSACAQGQRTEATCRVVMDNERALNFNAKTRP